MTQRTDEEREPSAKELEVFSGGEWEQHLEELRRRIIAVLVVFSSAALVAFMFSSHIAAFLTAPLTIYHVKLHTFAPAEKFMAHLHLAAWTGAIFAAPFFCVQAAFFLWPGLRGKEFRYVGAVLFAVPALFFIGAAACYRLLAPIVFGFFLAFGEGDGVEALWGLKEYLSLLFDLMLAAGLLLQMPLALLALLAAGVIHRDAVARYRPHAILLIFFFAAVLTPPDVVSQIMLGIPLCLLFEAALWLGGKIR
ncbi:MAG: twin-arginine translocase subunit TatC [Synergistaceae bacterium]|nr:twin-arginine translocase subunit TatC [Synergistaceae bacterium]